MATIGERQFGAAKSWGRFVMRELAAARRQLERNLRLVPQDQRPSVAEINALAGPHLAVLVHKRAKAYAVDEIGARSDKRWSAELERFADRWTHLTPDAVARERLIDVLDAIVAEEQQRLAAQSTAIPVTSRFDTSWAV